MCPEGTLPNGSESAGKTVQNQRTRVSYPTNGDVKMARTRIPKSVREAEAAIAAQDAAEQAEVAMQAQKPVENVAVENEQQAAPVEQAPEPVAQTQEIVPDVMEKEVAELKAQMKVLKEEHAVALEQAAYFKQRWDTLAGIHKKQVTDVQQQNRELTAKVSELEDALKSVPRVDEDLAAVKKDLGDKLDLYSDEHVEQMARNRRMAREAAESRLGKEINELRKRVATIDSSTVKAKSVGFWD